MRILLTAVAALVAAKPVTIASKDGLLEFKYSWSREAAAIPQNNRRFRAEAANERRDALAGAREDRKARLATAERLRHWSGHYFERVWETAGQSARLLSLNAGTETFTGGAHGNRYSTSLLWDRRLGREINRHALLLRTGLGDGAIRQPFCTLVDRERTHRREERVTRGDWPNQCPQLKELTLTLEDKDKDGRFDQIGITADPYVAGSWAEGEYHVSLPITAAMISRLKPEYLPSFEPQPPVQ